MERAKQQIISHADAAAASRSASAFSALRGRPTATPLPPRPSRPPRTAGNARFS